MTVMAISTARNNAELIEECAQLGYLTDTDLVLDPTYGLGRFWTRWQTIEFTNHAVGLGSRLVDQLHLPSYRPQPAGRRQVHARRNYSTLLVLQKDASK